MTEPSDDKSILEVTREMYHNHIKDPSPSQLEKAISEAVSKLVGHEYDCTISEVDFSKPSDQIGASITLSLAKDRSHLFG